jgi:hypothetical protein
LGEIIYLQILNFDHFSLDKGIFFQYTGFSFRNKEKKMVNIIFDWSGTIVKDNRLFYAETSKNQKLFMQIEHDVVKPYSDAIRVVSKFSETNPKELSNNNPKSITNSYIISDKDTLLSVSFVFDKLNGSADGIYAESDKLALAKKINADIFVEDDPRIALTLANANIKTIIPLRQWNKFFNYSIIKLLVSKDKIEKIENNIFFADDFLDIEQIIEGIINCK